MNNLAFGISSMQEAIIINRWRQSLAVALNGNFLRVTDWGLLITVLVNSV
jgi:hypothetical protein